MPRIVSILLAGSLLAHVALGCCGHVEHTCGRSQVSAAVLVAGECCGHCQQKPARPVDRDDPCKCRLECHGVCLFLPGATTQLDAPSAGNSSDVPTILAPAVTSSIAAALRWERLCQRFKSEWPLRLHLLHQILLI